MGIKKSLPSASYLFSNRYQFHIKSIDKNSWLCIQIIVYDTYVIISSSRKEYLEAEVTPWNLYVKGYGQNGCGNSACNCFIASGSDGPGIRLMQCQTTSNTKERYAICQYSECIAVDEQSGEDKNCIFPFK